MALIRVNPASVRAYGVRAQSAFDEMHRHMVLLVDEVVAVRYFGPHAVAFKTSCGELAVDIAQRFHQELAAMAEAVRRSTSNIAVSLGGEPIQLSIDPRPIVAPQPEVVDYVDVDTSALDALLSTIGTRFGGLRSQLSDHFHELQATDWLGNAKLSAVDAVGRFTNAAQQTCESGEQLLTTTVQRQVAAVVAADH